MDLNRYDREVSVNPTDTRTPMPSFQRHPGDPGPSKESEFSKFARELGPSFVKAASAIGGYLQSGRAAEDTNYAYELAGDQQLQFQLNVNEVIKSGRYDPDLVSHYNEEALSKIEELAKNEKQASIARRTFKAAANAVILEYTTKEGYIAEQKAIENLGKSARDNAEIYGENAMGYAFESAIPMLTDGILKPESIAVDPGYQFKANPQGVITHNMQKLFTEEYSNKMIAGAALSGSPTPGQTPNAGAGQNEKTQTVLDNFIREGVSEGDMRKYGSDIARMADILSGPIDDDTRGELYQIITRLSEDGLIKDELYNDMQPSATAHEEYKAFTKAIEEGKWATAEAHLYNFIDAGGESPLYRQVQDGIFKSKINDYVEAYGPEATAAALLSKDEKGNWLIGDSELTSNERLEWSEAFYKQAATEQSLQESAKKRMQDGYLKFMQQGIITGEVSHLDLQRGVSGDGYNGEFKGVPLSKENYNFLKAQLEEFEVARNERESLSANVRSADLNKALAEWQVQLKSGYYSSVAAARDGLEQIYAKAGHGVQGDVVAADLFKDFKFDKYALEAIEMLDTVNSVEGSDFYKSMQRMTDEGFPQSVLDQAKIETSEALYKAMYNENGELRANSPTNAELLKMRDNIFRNVVGENIETISKTMNEDSLGKLVQGGYIRDDGHGKYSPIVTPGISRKDVEKGLEDPVNTWTWGKDLTRVIDSINVGAFIGVEGDYMNVKEKYGRIVLEHAKSVFPADKVSELLYDDGHLPVVVISSLTSEEADIAINENYGKLDIGNREAIKAKYMSEEGMRVVLDYQETKGARKYQEYFVSYDDMQANGRYVARNSTVARPGTMLVTVDRDTGENVRLIRTDNTWRRQDELANGKYPGEKLYLDEGSGEIFIIIAGARYPVSMMENF